MEDFKDMKMLNIVRFAEYIVEHAEDFPQCLPLLREAFQALSIAERKLECLKQSFIKHYEENRKKSSEATGEEPDGNSNMVSMSSVTDYFTETEDGPPMKKKKNKKVSSVIDKSDSDANAGHLESHQSICGQSDFSPEHSTPNLKKKKKKKKKLIENSVDEEVKPMSPAPCVSPMDSKEELKLEETEENKEELLINTVSSVSCERDPLMPIRASSEAPTEASVSSRVSSMTPTKRRNSVCYNENSEYSSAQVPTCTDHERPPQPIFCEGEPGSYIPTSAMPSASNRIGSPGLRVIPSALLMENPLQLDAQPPETNNSLCTPDVQMDGTSNPHGQGAVEPESSNTRNNRNVLYFEFSRDVDKRKCICNEDVRTALKSLGLEDFQVIDINRSIPQMTCCSVEFRTRDFYRIFFTKELVINEVTARMKTSPPIASTVDGDSTGDQDDYTKIPALSRMRIPKPPKTKKKKAKKQKNNHKQNKNIATIKRQSQGIRKKRAGEQKQSALEMFIATLQKIQNGKIQPA